MNAPDHIVARLDALGSLLSDRYPQLVAERLADNPATGWINPRKDLPEEHRPVFFMTDSGHWAGERIGDDWCDWGDKGVICKTADVRIWQYAPQVSL